MDFISEYFYVIILLVGALAQWLKSRSESKDRGEVDQPKYGSPEVGAERPISRRAAPPPLPAHVPDDGRLAIPDRRTIPPPLADVIGSSDATAELARQRALMDKVYKSKRANAVRKPTEVQRPGAEPLMAPSGIRDRLHKRSELRSAFVLKEILEKPVGLRG